QGYATGQFGKNHLGDRNEFLPTVHGFDEFFGNLYHLNAEDEPENPDYPKNPSFKAQFGPRGVMKCVAVATDTPGDDPRFGTWGTSPSRPAKNTTSQRAYRVPATVRCPRPVTPRTEINDICSPEDWAPTLVAAAGEPDVKNKLLQGYAAAGQSFKVHLDGYDQ